MLLAVFLDALAVLVPRFDQSSAQNPLSRWDVVHFQAIADHGYQYEQQWAFLPALPLLIRASNSILGHEYGLKGVSFLISILTVDSFRVLHALSTIHLRSESLAHLTCVLALLPSSPATLFAAPYNEPFFTYLSYRGMLCCARKQWFLATLAFAAATSFRSNGIFLAGFVIWGLLIQPHLPNPSTILSLRTLLSTIYATLLTSLIFAPFLLHNYAAYAKFCLQPGELPEWCNARLPFIYTHVQAKYWGNGLFKYWSLQQLPNFLLAAPPLALLFTFGAWHLKQVAFSPAQVKPNPFASLSLTPHVIHALFTSSMLLFASHTQIILRLAAAMPTLYWAAAWLWCDPDAGKTKWANAWVYWSAIWGMVSIVLWVAFLPPA